MPLRVNTFEQDEELPVQREHVLHCEPVPGRNEKLKVWYYETGVGGK